MKIRSQAENIRCKYAVTYKDRNFLLHIFFFIIEFKYLFVLYLKTTYT